MHESNWVDPKSGQWAIQLWTYVLNNNIIISEIIPYKSLKVATIYESCCWKVTFSMLVDWNFSCHVPLSQLILSHLQLIPEKLPIFCQTSIVPSQKTMAACHSPSSLSSLLYTLQRSWSAATLSIARQTTLNPMKSGKMRPADLRWRL
jgi:hypothetical protein